MKLIRILMVLMAIVSTCFIGASKTGATIVRDKGTAYFLGASGPGFIGASKTNAEEMPVVIDKGVSVSYKGVVYDLFSVDVVLAFICDANGNLTDETAPIIEVFYANSSDTVIGRFFIASDVGGNDIEIVWIVAENPNAIKAWADMDCSGDFVKRDPNSKMFLPICHLGKQSL